MLWNKLSSKNAYSISKKRVLQCFILPCFLPLNVLWSKPRSCETLGFLTNDKIRVSVSRLILKCIWSDIFWHNLTCSICKLIDCKLLSSPNKNLAVILALKTTQCYLKMVRRLVRVCCTFSSCDAVLWTELITKKSFWGETTCRAILNWVLSLIP